MSYNPSPKDLTKLVFIDPPNYPLAKLLKVPYPIGAKSKITMHITQGQTAEGAIQTFLTSLYRTHFLIDRDENATVYQLQSISDPVWHASAVNGVAVGIEHVAIAAGTCPKLPEGLLPTEAQYRSSAALVRWLGIKLGIPIDQAHVQGHNVASPQDKHVQCGEPTLNVGRIIEMANHFVTIPTIPS